MIDETADPISETFDPINGDLRKAMPAGFAELKENQYTAAVILHTTSDDGVVRVIFPMWLSLFVNELDDTQRRIAYDMITSKIFAGIDDMLAKFRGEITK